MPVSPPIAILAKYRHQHHLAVDMGATRCLEPNTRDPIEADACILTVANTGAVKQALASVRKGGRVVLVAGMTGPLLVHLGPVVDGEMEVVGSNCYGEEDIPGDIARAVELLRDRTIVVDRLISHTFELKDIGQAFATAADKSTGATKVIVTP